MVAKVAIVPVVFHYRMYPVTLYPPVAFMVLGMDVHAIVTKDPLFTVHDNEGTV